MAVLWDEAKMRETDLSPELTALLDGPRGTVMPIPGRPGSFWVKGSSMVYEVFLRNDQAPAPPSCECDGFKHRGRCFHLTAAEKFELGGWPTAAEEAMACFKALDPDSQRDVFA